MGESPQLPDRVVVFKTSLDLISAVSTTTPRLINRDGTTLNRLNGKTALVTGAARGIGACVAQWLAEAGAEVLLTDVDEEAGAGTAAEIAQRGFPATFVRHDVSSETDWEAAIERAQGQFDGLDVLVNNAGIVLIKSIADTTLLEWHRLCRVNIDGIFLGMKHVLPAMRDRALENPAGGSIINMSSAVGIVGVPNALAYSMTKAAIRHMTKSAAMEFAEAGYNIRVNSVHPGIIKTAMSDEIFDTWATAGAFGTHDRRETEQVMVAQHPIGRHGQPEDIAKGVLFLASDDSSYMTGAELVIDGGYTAK